MGHKAEGQNITEAHSPGHPSSQNLLSKWRNSPSPANSEAGVFRGDSGASELLFIKHYRAGQN